MSSTVLRRGLRAAASTVAACRASTNVFPARSAATEIGASYHTGAAWRTSRAACGAPSTAVGGKNAAAQQLLFGGACGTSVFGGAGESVVGRVAAPGPAALPFALQMLVGSLDGRCRVVAAHSRVSPRDRSPRLLPPPTPFVAFFPDYFQHTFIHDRQKNAHYKPLAFPVD